MQIDFKKEIFNDAFYPLLEDESRFLVLMGGAGSGKSYFLADKWIYRVLSESGHRVIISRKVSKTIRVSVYKLICDRILKHGLSEFFDIRDSDMTIRCPMTDSEFIALGVDDKEKVKSLADPTGMWIEEVTELSEREFRQMAMRVRGKANEGVKYKQITLSFNPIDEDHWIHREMFPLEIDQKLKDKIEKRRKFREKYGIDYISADKRTWVDWSFKDVASKMVRKVRVGSVVVDRTYTLHRSTHEDNYFMEPEDRAELIDLMEKDENYYRVYALGEWGSVGNLVFNPAWRILRAFPTEFDEIVYGIDFGYNHPSALVMVGIRDDELYVKELLYVKKLTNSQLIEYILKERLIKNMDDVIYADSAEPARIDEFAEAGFNIRPSVKGNNSLMDSIDYLKSKKIYSHSDNVNLNRELRTFKWQEDAEGKPIDGKVVPLNDDCIAATRYAAYSRHRQSDVKFAIIG
jgi:phage terminase large subunit